MIPFNLAPMTLLMFHSSHRPISLRFRDKRRFPSNITKFSHLPRIFNVPAERVPLRIWYQRKGHKSFYDVATRCSKTFYDRFSRLDTIPAVTNSQPPSQPRRRSIYRAMLRVARVKILDLYSF